MQKGATAYTQLCAMPPTTGNRLELPDTSGVVLTTGTHFTTQFTCFTGTKVQILTLKKRLQEA